MQHCDVLVVGGGPAGSACAWRLATAGLDVVVLEEANFPQDKTCCGWIAPPVLNHLGVTPTDYSGGRTLQPVTGFRLQRLGDRMSEIRYGQVVSYGVRRSELDKFVLERSGARLYLGEPLKKLERKGDEWVANWSVAAPMIVGAGGHNCPVARKLGVPDHESVVQVQATEVEMSPQQDRACRVRPDTPELYFTPDLDGCGWLFRKGHALSIGMGVRGSNDLSARTSSFVDFLVRRRRIAPKTTGEFRGGAYLVRGDSRRERIGDGLLLVGDAAGTADDRTGAGILPAVDSGLLAASTILEARKIGNFSRETLQTYGQSLAKHFGQRRRLCATAKSLLPKQLLNSAAGRLIGSQWFARRFVVEGRLLPPTGAV